jgi:hypothetical protein
MNLLQETLEELEDFPEKEISWARITTESVLNHKDETIVLKPNYTQEDKDNFFRSLNFEYDNGYGFQEIDGVIVFTDNTWMMRREYDGSEWWGYFGCPQWKEED